MILSFSLSAVVRLGVPPGKWFCLARTGLGYSQYSCCVCKAHQDVFEKFWKANHRLAHLIRLEKSIENSLNELGYQEHFFEMKRRLMDLVTDGNNFVVNAAFMELISNLPPRLELKLITDGPQCLVNLVRPKLGDIEIITGKSSNLKIGNLSDIHVGTNESDLLHVPQTKFLITRKTDLHKPVGVQIFPKLTSDVMQQIII